MAFSEKASDNRKIRCIGMRMTINNFDTELECALQFPLGKVAPHSARAIVTPLKTGTDLTNRLK
jgi:hypothetical protein